MNNFLNIIRKSSAILLVIITLCYLSGIDDVVNSVKSDMSQIVIADYRGANFIDTYMLLLIAYVMLFLSMLKSYDFYPTYMIVLIIGACVNAFVSVKSESTLMYGDSLMLLTTGTTSTLATCMIVALIYIFRKRK